MRDLKILHTAGLGLAAPLPGLPAAIGQLRRRDAMQTLARLADYCRREQTDLFIISGDLWQQEYVTRPLADFVADQFRKIPATKVLIAPGPLDDDGGRGFYARYPWPGNVHILAETSLVLPDFPLRVQGLSWKEQEGPRDWRTLASGGPDEMVLIVAYGTPESLNIPPWLVNQSNLAYIALGGQPNRTKWGEKMADPGFPEPRSFSFSGPFGVLAGTIGAANALDFIPFSSRRFIPLRLNLEGCPSLKEAAARIERELAPHDLERDLCELTLWGPRPPGEWNRRALEESVKGVYIRLVDETGPSYDLEALAIEHNRGILGKYIAWVKESGPEEKSAERALAFGVDALLTGRVAPW